MATCSKRRPRPISAATCAALLACATGAFAQENGGDPRVDPGVRPPRIPVSGTPQPALGGIETAMLAFMRKRQIPGGALAITHRGRLVYDRGFGYGDLGPARRPGGERKVPVSPDARFRIASLSKPFTAVAILQLIEAGKLRWHDEVWKLLAPEPFEQRKPANDFFEKVTIRHLLQHTGGWNREATFDPMFRSHLVAIEAGHDRPAGTHDIIRYMAGRGLEFEPGKYFAYSNFGYCLLGRVLEKVAGQSYADYVREHVMAPLGIHRMVLGRTRFEHRLPGEVVYYGKPGSVARCVFGPRGTRVPWPYGGFYLEAMDSHGAWVASARDVLRFARDFDDPGASRLLGAGTIAKMLERPKGHVGYDKGKPRARYYGCGWTIQTGKVDTREHGGSLPGTTAKLVCRNDGVNWVVLFNTRRDGKGRRIHPDDIIPSMHGAIESILRWPDHDLFDR